MNQNQKGPHVDVFASFINN